MSPTVLVTAATGTVGQHVVGELADCDATVRVGTRDPDGARERFTTADRHPETRDRHPETRDRHPEPGGDHEFVDFDFERPETWGAALDGVDALFLVRPPTVEEGQVRSFADAAARVGVRRVAYLSTLGADRNVLIPHHRIERHLRGTGLSHVFLRASFFAQNLHEVHGEDVRAHDEIFVPAGTGATSFVDARDVGAVAAVVLTEPGHDRTAYDLTGPAALTYGEVATTFSAVLDRGISYADPSIPAFVARMYRRGHPLGYVLLMVGIYTTVRLGLADRVTDDVERLLGRPPRELREYVVDYAEEFRSTARR